MIVSNGNGGTQQTQGGIDWQGLIGVGSTLLNRLLSSGQKEELERQRIELEASLRQKLEAEAKSLQLLIAGLGILLILALLLRR